MFEKRGLSSVERVVQIMHKNKLNSFIDKLGLRHYLHLIDRHSKTYSVNFSNIVKTFSDLGGVYLILAQFLSRRPDLVPSDLCFELSQIDYESGSDNYSDVKKKIELELKRSVDRVFRHVDEVPLFSDHLFQYHKARLRDSTPVIIKIIHNKDFENDLHTLRFLAHKGGLNLPSIVEKFQEYLKRVLDLSVERQMINLMHKVKTVRTPKTYPAYSTKNVLVFEFLDRTQEVQDIMKSCLSQIFSYGLFQTNYNKQNVFFNDNSLSFLDYSNVSKVEKFERDFFLKLYYHLVCKNPHDVANVIFEYCKPSISTDVDCFVRDIEKISFTPPYCGSELTNSVLFYCSKHSIVLPDNFSSVAGAISSAESFVLSKNPEYNFVKENSKIFAKYYSKLFSQKEIHKFLECSDSFEFGQKYQPMESNKEFDLLKRLGIDIRHSSSRLSFALIAAASILAGSQLHNVPPFFQDLSVPMFVTYLLACVCIILLIHSILIDNSQES